MRIVRYMTPEGDESFGIVMGTDVCELVGDVLEEPRAGRRVARLDEVTLLAPCRPSKVVCVAVNFPGIENYSAEMEEPLVFIKPASSIVGPNASVNNPFPDLRWWGEAELGVVIRRRAQRVPLASVRDYVLGFTIGNDVTVENCDGRDHHLARSKAANGFCPLGPWIETTEPAEPFIIEAIQDGQVVRRGSSHEQFWQWPEIVSRISQWMTLEPFDVILTGNPPDVSGMRYLGTSTNFEAKVHPIGSLKTVFHGSR